MQKVSNRKCIRRLSVRTLKAARGRNVIAVLAIVLTTVLFTSLFTIAMSVNKSFEEQNFRQAGGDYHGTFKNVTAKQIEELKGDSRIEEMGTRILLGMPEEAPFLKSHVEVGYLQADMAEHSFCVPVEGRLPKEGTNEAATDTRVLKLLGVEPKVGERFTITYVLGAGTTQPVTVTETFTLSGWWEYDEANIASMVVVPLSYVNQVMAGYERQGAEDMTGRCDMDVMLKSSLQIEKTLKAILADHGYQNDDEKADNYIAIGVNWGYVTAQLSQKMDITTLAGMIVMLVLIVFSGYLIIYNIFRISVTGDIRYYGLLKTIGTTGRQTRRLILRQALLLAGIGIPLGLLAGWFAGAKLTPVVMNALSYKNTAISLNPLIFLGAALFSLITVLLSCRKPAKLASRVSPIEAVRYTEGKAGRKKEKHSENGGKVWRMALANLGRSKSKTALVLISMSLSVVLLNTVFTFTNGFDMDKYLSRQVSADYIYAHADYFQDKYFADETISVGEEMIAEINRQGGVTGGGRIYSNISAVSQCLPEAELREVMRIQGRYTEAEIDNYVKAVSKNEQGRLRYRIDLYGMEQFPLSKVRLIEGDLEKLSEEGQIAAVMYEDDYGKPEQDGQHYQLGDKVTLFYVDEYEYIDSRTGETATDETPDEYVDVRYIKTHEKTYTVCARVSVPHSMGYRRYGTEQMILPAEELKQQAQCSVMNYLFDMEDEATQGMEDFMKDYTENTEVVFDYESRLTYVEEFKEFRNMFLFMGGILSFIVGLIGVLNYINAITTSVISRKREFAILQAVGMTGSQLKKMLIMEGCAYGMGAVLTALLLNIGFAPLASGMLGSMLWFYSYHFTVLPIVCIIPVFLLFGILIPLIAYRQMEKQTLVDRIRNLE